LNTPQTSLLPETPHDLQWPALLDAQAQLQSMLDAWWRVNDDLRLLRGQDANEAQAITEVHTDLDILARQLRRLQRGVNDMADLRSRRRDAAAMKALTPTGDQANAVRERLVQIDLNLSALYRHLQPMCRQTLASLGQEGDTDSLPPLWDAEVRVDLDYMMDETHPQYNEHSNNILASQEAIVSSLNAQGKLGDILRNDTEQDNWLDYPHPWMSRQGWLTHDLLEHDYGKHPHFGVATLLHTQSVWVEVHTVRSYVYDLQTGCFVAPKADQ
jgi:hypothetical protein